ncbi:ABC transporter substrate-binding protein, partial [Paenibacillus sepulcri]|nr:ABC transporter substrate-binding protein [Paenibacillus sepulcri]
MTILILCTGLAAGCKPEEGAVSEPSPSNPDQPQAEGKQTLVVLTNRVDLVENGVFQKYADQFQKSHPEAVVEFDAPANYTSDVLVRLSTRTMGDVLLLPNNITNEELANYFEPLDAEMFEGMRFADYKAYNGVRYGLTTGISTEGIVYNKKAFEKAGITDIPTTLDEFYMACQQLKQAGILPIYLNYGAQWPMLEWGENLVGSMAGDAGYLNNMVYTDAPWQLDNPWGKAIGIVKTLIGHGYTEKDLISNNWEMSKSQIAGGQVAMYFLGNWVIKQVIDAGADSSEIGFFPFPYDNKADKRYVALSPDWFVGVSKFSENKELAKEWIEFFVKESGYVNDSGFLPVEQTKTSELPQLKQFQTFNPIYLERQSPSDNFLKLGDKAQIAFWSGDYIQEFIAAADLKQAFRSYNEKWAEARKLIAP